MMSLALHSLIRRCLFTAIFFLSIVLLSAFMTSAVSADTPQPDFFASFDGTPNAVAADGTVITPQAAQGLTYVNGLHGKAVQLGPGGSATLQYAAGNLLKPSGGAIVFWVKPNWEGSARIGDQQPIYSLFDAGLRLHIFQFAWLRADLGEADDPASGKTGGIDSLSDLVRSAWHAGDWWQVALSWNSSGWTKLYVDGLPYTNGYETLSTTQVHHALDFGAVDHFLVGNGADAAFCDLAIYRAPLTDADVMAQYRKVMPLDMIVDRCFLRAGTAEQFALDVWPGGQETKPSIGAQAPTPVMARIDVSVKKVGGNAPIAAKTYTLALKGHRTLLLPVSRLAAGEYLATANVSYNGSMFRRSYLLTAYRQALAPAASTQSYALGKPIVQIDCAEQPQGLLSDAPTQAVLNQPIGNYREAGAKNGSRFSYELDLSSSGITTFTGQPMALQITWPDDKPRSMGLFLYKDSPGVQQQRDRLEGGIQSGTEFALSHKMQTTTYVIFPWTAKYLFEARTEIDGYPAAIAKIVVRPIIGGRLPKLAIRTPAAGQERYFGDFDEDQSFDVMYAYDDDVPQENRTLRDLEILLDYMDYTGQNLISYAFMRYGDVEYSLPGGAATGGPYMQPTAGLQSLMLDMLAARGKKLAIAINSYTVAESNKQPDKQADLLAEDYYQIDRTGKPVQDRVGDLLANPLNATYRAQYFGHIDDLLQRYGRHPATYGIDIWPGDWQITDINTGYDDLTISDFQHDTGISVPGTGDGRFAARYTFLTGPQRGAWLSWRAQKNTDLISETVRRVRTYNPNLVVRIIVSGTPMSGASDDVSEAGLDFAKYYYADESLNLPQLFKIDGLSMAPMRRTQLRWQQQRDGTLDTSDEVLDDIARQSLFHNSNVRSADTYLTYFESFENSLKPSPYNSLFENADVKPWGRFFLKDFAEEVASVDPQVVVVGAQPVGTAGRDAEAREFAAALRALPSGRFQGVTGLTGSVCGRYLATKDGVYCYLQSLIEGPATVTLSSARLTAMTDLSTGLRQEPRRQWTITLLPFQLRSFRLPTGSGIISGSGVVVDNALQETYASALADAQKQVTQLDRSTGGEPQYDHLVAHIHTAIAAGDYPEAHRLLFTKQMRLLSQVQLSASSGYLKAENQMIAAGHIALKCGSADFYKADDGTLYFPDQGYQPGGFGFFGGHSSSGHDTSVLHAGIEQGLYSTEAYDTGGYRFTVPNGRYTVRLHNSILYQPDAVPNRVVMTLLVQGKKVWDKMDLYQALQNNNSNVLATTFIDVEVADGTLTLEWQPVNGRLGWCNAIEIVPQKAATQAGPGA